MVQTKYAKMVTVVMGTEMTQNMYPFSSQLYTGASINPCIMQLRL